MENSEITFDKWCYSKQIKGNWKEALFHHIMTKYAGQEVAIDNFSQDELACFWNEVLEHIWKNVPTFRHETICKAQ